MNTPLSQVLENKILQNWVSWGLIQATVSFFRMTAERINLLQTRSILDEYLALIKRFSPQHNGELLEKNL